MALLILQELKRRLDCVSSSRSSARGMKVRFKSAVIDINMHTYVYIYIYLYSGEAGQSWGRGLWGCGSDYCLWHSLLV